ncbi:MAG: hypothetical protein OXF61_16205 [Acidimicrobiaceae bacterium]|nr:hypothetical protein [Acidimicrobiaceae bacterium]
MRTVTLPVPVVVTDTVREDRPAPLTVTVAEIPDMRLAEHDADDGDTVIKSVMVPGPLRVRPVNPLMVTGWVRAVNVAVSLAVVCPVRLQVTRTDTEPVPAVVTDTALELPERSVTDTVAEIPETRLALHDADDGDTVNPSDMCPGPSRVSPSQPLMLTAGGGAHVTVTLIRSVSNLSFAVRVAVPDEVHVTVAVFDRE